VTWSRRLTALIVSVAVLGLVGGSTRVAAAPAPRPPLGVYRGAHNVAGVKAFQQWVGSRVGYALDFVPADNWTTISNPCCPGFWKPAPRSQSFRLVLGVPIIPYSGGSLQIGATGAYNGYFQALARKLVRLRLGNAILRLGWEFSGGWYPWSVHSNDEATQFAEYWRQIVTTMRATAPALKFDWNPAHGWRPFDINLAYPGNAYVDYIGMDVYDQGWIPDVGDPVARWKDLVNGDGGLLWHRNFAREKGKRMTFPEWGLTLREDGHGGGDDPYFIQQMAAWIASNHVAYHVYFEFDASDGAHRLMTGRFPSGAAVFRQQFGKSEPPSVAR
jgi:glycosyl hydrolase family 26